MTRVIKDDTSLVINGSPNSLAFDTLDFLFLLLLVLLFWLKINSSKTKQKMDRIEKISERNFIKLLNITDGAKSAYYSSINGLKDFGNKLTSLTSDIGTSLKSAAGSLDHLFTDQIGGSLSNVGTGLVDGAKDVWGSISSGATDVANSISSGAKDVINNVGSGLSSISHSVGRKYKHKESLVKFYFIDTEGKRVLDCFSCFKLFT